jgi:crossover junction endodeoxyribonuclease RuvC
VRRILGIDPGLRNTGWAVIEDAGQKLSFIAAGEIRPDPELPLAQRLAALHAGLCAAIKAHRPDSAAVEETFVNANARAALKLGAARGVALLVPALCGLSVAEYAPNAIKKAVVGAGHAQKAQIRMMVRILLADARFSSDDAADALALAICHAHHPPDRGAS